MDRRSSLSEKTVSAQKNVRRIPRLICGVLLAILVVLIFPLLSHTSTRPWALGLYSKSYTAIILIHFAAIGLTLLALSRARQQWADAVLLVGTYGFAFWSLMSLLSVFGAFGVFWATGDTDFRNLGFALLAGAVCLWWVIFHYARFLLRVLTNTALALTAALLMLLVAELILARFPIVSPSLEFLRAKKAEVIRHEIAVRTGKGWYESFLMSDPELAYKHRPNFQNRPEDLSNLPTRGFKTDHAGFFNEDSASSQPFDVACIGDSFVFVQWSDILREKTGLRVGNFGVMGYSPPQYTIVLKRYVLKLKPKAVFYCIYANDAFEAAEYEEWKKSGTDWFTFQRGAWFGYLSSHIGRLFVKEHLLRFSRIYALLDLALIHRRQSPLAGLAARSIPSQSGNLNLVFERGFFIGLTDMKNEKVQRGLMLIRDSLAEAGRLCREANVRLIVILIPPKELVHYDTLRSLARPDDPIGNLPEFYRALREICGALNLEFYDVTERFREESAKSGKAFYKALDVHWDKEGRELMAQIAAEILASSGDFGHKSK
jgi:hypothetical protein